MARRERPAPLGSSASRIYRRTIATLRCAPGAGQYVDTLPPEIKKPFRKRRSSWAWTATRFCWRSAGRCGRRARPRTTRSGRLDLRRLARVTFVTFAANRSIRVKESYAGLGAASRTDLKRSSASFCKPPETISRCSPRRRKPDTPPRGMRVFSEAVSNPCAGLSPAGFQEDLLPSGSPRGCGRYTVT